MTTEEAILFLRATTAGINTNKYNHDINSIAIQKLLDVLVANKLVSFTDEQLRNVTTFGLIVDAPSNS